MPLDPAQIALAMADGLSAVCATCTRYWEGRARGMPGHSCTAKDGCAGPMAGGDFHEYDGPMKSALHLWCFVCGIKSRYGVRVGGSVRVFGACEEHVKMLRELQPKDRPDLGKKPTAVTPANGGIAHLPQYPVKSLARAITEVERYYAAKEGREPDL